MGAAYVNYEETDNIQDHKTVLVEDADDEDLKKYFDECIEVL